jgi:hypothetical protein
MTPSLDDGYDRENRHKIDPVDYREAEGEARERQQQHRDEGHVMQKPPDQDRPLRNREALRPVRAFVFASIPDFFGADFVEDGAVPISAMNTIHD